MLKKLIYIYTFLFCGFSLYSQRNFDSVSLAIPVDIPVLLSANFGELRPNHYHMGIDIKTESVVGKNILSAEKGYISRIRVMPGGYGKALYITHPDIGLVTVYGHLLFFNDTIEKALLNYQLRNKSSVVDFSLEPGEIPVKKGEFVAYSGNTGGSQGPHLHFEVRDAVTEKCYNPFMFYPQIKDRTYPRLYGFVLYPRNSQSKVQGNSHKRYFKAVARGGGKYVLNTPIQVQGEVGVGLKLQDFITGFPHKFGLYNVKMYVDSVLVYEHQLDTLSFDGQRYINSLLDYEAYVHRKGKYQRLFVEPNNKSDIYKMAQNDGFLAKTTGTHEIVCVAEDFHKNKLSLSFKLQFSKAEDIQKDSCATVFHSGVAGRYEDKHIVLDYGTETFYDDFCFDFSVDSTYRLSKAASYIYNVHSKTLPVHDEVFLRIKDEDIKSGNKNKMVLARLYGRNKMASAGGWVDGSSFCCPINRLGKYVLAYDTVAPRISPLVRISGRKHSYTKKFIFKVSDNLSGVSQFWAIVDGKWAPMEYDAKSSKMYLYLKSYLFKNSSSNKHTLKIVVFDERENRAEYSTWFYR